MNREEMAGEIALFCKDAPELSYLVRFDATNSAVNTFIWVRCTPNIDAIVHHVPKSWDIVMFKGPEGVIGIGHYCQYVTKDFEFDKELYLKPE